jgi:hypothetical protein
MITIHRIALAAAFVVVVAISARAQEDATGTPLEDITHDMKVAANHLSKKVTDKPPQVAQEEAVAKLDKLIEELEKERQSMGSGSTPNPSRPAMGELHGTRDQGDRWGQLPPHERDRILQSLTEGFPPHYQAILEAYYKRLAIEKRADEPDAAAPPTKASPKVAAPKPVVPAPAKSPMPAKKNVK